MRFVAVLFVGILLLAIALVAYAPATLIDQRLSTASSGKLRLSDTAGTVWNGNGVLTDSSGTWRIPLGWQTSLTGLLKGALAVTLLPTPRGSLDIRSGEIAVAQFAADAPASVLAAALPMRNLVTFGGNLALTAPNFTWNGTGGTGTLDVRWNAARLVALGTVADLGTVEATLVPDDKGLRGSLSNSGGDLRIAGTLALVGPELRVDAALTPTADAPVPILRALAALGRQDADGTVRIAWRGNVR